MVAFVLEPTASTSREIRRVTQERLDQAISTLESLDRCGADEIERAVHEVRKRCKAVRAVAQLVRSSLGDEFKRFTSEVRQAADELAPIRDAHAILATFDDLRATLGRTGDAELDVVRAAQAADADAATSGVRGSDPRIERAHTLLVAARKRVARWDVPDGFDAVGAGIEDTYRRGRRALRRACEAPSDDHLHEWRKSTKHLWYEMRLIERAAPSVLGSLVATLDDLAEALGDDHDLAVLIERLDADPEHFGGRRQTKQARRLARAQQADLRRRALRLGATVYAETPRAFTDRMRRYWELTVEHGTELATGGIAELAHEERPISIKAKRHQATHLVERERKFLISKAPALPPHGVLFRQGYLAIDGNVSVRVRDAADEGCTMTFKAGRGAVRTELEWPLTDDQFRAAWEQTEGRRVHKTRYRLPLGDLQVELDVFHDDLDGLVIAEVEFDTDEQMEAFRPPRWFGREVTDDDAYTNASLAATARRGIPG